MPSRTCTSSSTTRTLGRIASSSGVTAPPGGAPGVPRRCTAETGSAARVSLPLGRGDPRAAARSARNCPGMTRARSRRGGVMPPTPRARVLCVDDEPNVLAGLMLHLRRRYDVETAPSGAAGLDVLRRYPDTAVVVSDMRMPGMDGAAFLRTVRSVSPDTTRVLLTGHADLESAITAVNEGQLFRFLTKPCPPEALLASVAAAAEQHRLITSERELLEKTLRGSVSALTDVLSLANPLAFGRATRLRQLVGEIAARLQLRERWPIEVAATFSQMAAIILPPEIVEKLQADAPLSADERAMAERLPSVTERLLSNIPRLESVRAILAAAARPRCTGAVPDADPLVSRGAEILRIAIDFDVLEAQGHAGPLAVDILLGRSGYDGGVLEA